MKIIQDFCGLNKTARKTTVNRINLYTTDIIGSHGLPAWQSMGLGGATDIAVVRSSVIKLSKINAKVKQSPELI